MNKRTGILLENNDLKISVKKDSQGKILSGLVIGNTLYQNQYIILKLQKNQLYHAPTIGAGIDDIINDDDILEWKKTIREEFAKDGLKVNKVNINQATKSLHIVADY